jgi:YEATS domain-containing protein 4
MTATDTARLQNTTANLPLAYGSIAFYLGPQSDEYHTHKWTLYLRSPDPNFDLGKAISKVVFQLHPSFSVPTRELTEPPFEVTESGWGEFEASIRVIWREVAEERSTIVSSICIMLCFDGAVFIECLSGSIVFDYLLHQIIS